MTTPLVSLLIPCFNAEKYIGETLKSVFGQTWQNIEVIVVDDGSTDGSANIARGFGTRIRLLSGPNSGASAARNWGIAESRGEWLIFLDADDALLPQTIKRRLETAATNPEADVIVCRWQELIETGSAAIEGPVRTINRTAIEADAEVATATQVWAPPAAIMYHRKLVERIGDFRLDLPVIQDARFLFDAAYHGARFAYSDHPGALYRIQQDSLSRRDPERFWSDCLLNGTQIEALWQARGTLTTAQREALASIYNNAARGLFSAESPRYFEAIDRQRGLGTRLPRHSRIAPPIAKALGLRSARQLFALVGR